MISFCKTLNQIINLVRQKEPDVGRVLKFPDFSSQIYVDGSDFQWYSHPVAEMELDIVHKRSGVVSPSERLKVYKKWIDPGTVIILRSHLHPRQVATYHMVFPFIVGVRKNVGGKKFNTMVNVVNMLNDKRKQLSQEYMTGFQLEEQKVDTILSAIDIQVLENGAMRGYLQDQWNDDAGCPAERPFVFMTIIANGDLFDCGFLKDKNGDLNIKENGMERQSASIRINFLVAILLFRVFHDFIMCLFLKLGLSKSDLWMTKIL